MNTHPEALRLADELDVGDFDVVTNYEAASELRRLHEENERLKAATPVQEPVKPSLWERYHEAQTTTPPAALVQLAWVWQQAPVKTQWGHDMVVADLAIDKDHTVSIYCELDQTSKVEAMFTPPAAPVQEPVAWMYVNKSTHETKFQKHMRDFVDHSLWSEVPLYGEPLANHELQCVCGAVWMGDEMVHLPDKRPPASKPWVGLTQQDINIAFDDTQEGGGFDDFAHAIEAKLREKNQ